MSARTYTFQIEVLLFSKRRNGHFMPPGVSTTHGEHGLPMAPHRTLLRDAKNADSAKRSAAKIGSVISCRKLGASPDRRVSLSPYFRNIESLNLGPKPILVTLEQDYALTEPLEQIQGQVLIEVIDKE